MGHLIHTPHCPYLVAQVPEVGDGLEVVRVLVVEVTRLVVVADVDVTLVEVEVAFDVVVVEVVGLDPDTANADCKMGT